MQNFPPSRSYLGEPHPGIYHSSVVASSGSYAGNHSAPGFRTGPYNPNGQAAVLPQNIPYPMNHGTSQSFGARPMIPTYSAAYAPAFSYLNHEGSLRDLAPVQHLHQQPHFRAGTPRRYEQTHPQGTSLRYQQNIQHHPVYSHGQGMLHGGAFPHGQFNQPPPPPPPPGGFNPQYRPHAPYNNCVQRPAKKQRFDFYCETCTKGFECEEDYDIHVAEDHVTCSHPGCGFSAREDVVRAHKVKHTVNTDSKEEVEAWVAMRRFKFPRKSGACTAEEEPKVVSKLERSIRSSIRQAKIDARKQRLAKDQKQPCIHWERSGKCRFGDSCSFGHEKQGVCTFFVNHGRCRHGDSCKYKHVKGSSRELDELRNPHGGLLKKLLSVETSRWEGSILQVLRHAVNSNFYQSGAREDVEPEESTDEETDLEEPFSPISNAS